MMVIAWLMTTKMATVILTSCSKRHNNIMFRTMKVLRSEHQVPLASVIILAKTRDALVCKHLVKLNYLKEKKSTKQILICNVKHNNIFTPISFDINLHFYSFTSCVFLTFGTVKMYIWINKKIIAFPTSVYLFTTCKTFFFLFIKWCFNDFEIFY